MSKGKGKKSAKGQIPKGKSPARSKTQKGEKAVKSKARKTEKVVARKGVLTSKSGGDMTVALAYPNTYEVAMSSLGYQIILRRLNEIKGVLCLRLFVPEGDLKGRPAQKTYDHPREVARTDWLAFSASYENDYLNILKIIDASGLPLEWKNRDNHHPLVIIGGIAPSLNPEPLAEFADLFVIGEAEEVLEQMVKVYLLSRKKKMSRKDLLLEMAQIPGIYVPRFYEAQYRPDGLVTSLDPIDSVPSRVKRLWLKDLDRFPAASDIVSEEAEFKNMILVEVGRGCGRGCRFCAAGFFYRPVRYRSFNAIREIIGSRLLAGHRLGLLGSSVFDHPNLGKIVEHLEKLGCPFSVSSLRADALELKILQTMASGGLKTVTIAPETGTERLRIIIKKNIRDKEIFEAVQKITVAGIPNIKLYFMIGLPHEIREDIEGIVELVKKIRHHILQITRGKGSMGQIIVSLSCFVPKAWTPFQWHPMDDLESLSDKQRYLKNALSRIPNVKVIHDLPKWSFIQAFISRGDRRVGEAIKLAHIFGGNWKKALRHSPINPEFYIYRPRGYREFFPWEFIDTGLQKSFLWGEYMESLTGLRQR